MNEIVEDISNELLAWLSAKERQQIESIG